MTVIQHTGDDIKDINLCNVVKSNVSVFPPGSYFMFNITRPVVTRVYDKILMMDEV